MRNKYEASEMVELGEAREIILGSKPDVSEVDAILGVALVIPTVAERHRRDG